MKTIVIISVHATSKNTFSSANFNGYKEFNSGKEAMVFIKENKFAVKETYTDAELKLKLIYLKTYEHNKNRNMVEQLFINGFSEDASKYWDKQECIKNEERKKKGFVYYKRYDEMTTEDYKGDLQNALTDNTMDYISSGVVAGYLGHSFRQLAHDRHIEEAFKNIIIEVDEKVINKWDTLSTWLSSTDARHWMDSVEDTTIEQFKERFNAYIPNVVQLGYIYSLKEHEGTMRSTMALIESYKNRINVQVAS